MTDKPQPNPTQKPQRRKHIPALSADKLELAVQQIQTLPISKGAKAQLTAMLQAAANPDAERPDVVLKTLEPERQANAQETMQRVGDFFDGVTMRGRAALLEISKEQWDALLNDE